MNTAGVKIADTFLDTLYGRIRLLVYKQMDESYCYGLCFGDIEGKKSVFCRLQSACITSEIFGAVNCDCREQLDKSFEICKEKSGIIIYLPQEGRGNGIEAKLKQIAIENDDPEINTILAFKKCGYPLDSRKYDVACKILHDLKISSVCLYTKSPYKVNAIEEGNIKVVERVDFRLEIHHKQALKNIKAKEDLMGYFPSLG